MQAGRLAVLWPLATPREGAPRCIGYCQVQVLRVIWSLKPHGLTACQDLGRSKVCNARDVANQQRHNVLPLVDESEPAVSGQPSARIKKHSQWASRTGTCGVQVQHSSKLRTCASRCRLTGSPQPWLPTCTLLAG